MPPHLFVRSELLEHLKHFLHNTVHNPGEGIEELAVRAVQLVVTLNYRNQRTK